MPLRVQATLVFGVKVSRWAKTPLSSGVTVVVTTGIRQDQQAELKEVQLQYREGTAVPSVSHVSFSVRGTWGSVPLCLHKPHDLRGQFISLLPPRSHEVGLQPWKREAQGSERSSGGTASPCARTADGKLVPCSLCRSDQGHRHGSKSSRS